MSGLVQGLRERATWCNMQPGYGQIGFEVTTAADRIIELEALLGNAVGAIIDSGGYCEGPHDVAAAIYRLTAERDALKARLTPPDESRSAGSWQTMVDPYKARPHRRFVRLRVVAATEARQAVSAMSPAPVGLEGHTDPKEAP